MVIPIGALGSAYQPNALPLGQTGSGYLRLHGLNPRLHDVVQSKDCSHCTLFFSFGDGEKEYDTQILRTECVMSVSQQGS